MTGIKLALAQINPTLGAFEENAEKLLACSVRAKEAGAAFMVAAFGALSGHPAGSFARRAEFLLAQKEALDTLKRTLAVPALIGIVPGPVWVEKGEARLVVNGEVLTACGTSFGVLTDLRAPSEQLSELKLRGAKAVLVCAAEPYRRGRRAQRLKELREAACENALPLVFVNLVGGADEWVFDGAGFALNAEGHLLGELACCAEDFLTVALEGPCIEPRGEDALGELYAALTLALGDYVRKNGFTSVQLGLSGGVDSALVAALAADALGPENVYALMMPTHFTAQLSLQEAKRLAENLGIHYAVHPIEALFDAYRRDLAGPFEGRSWDTTEENLQARIRGNLLMAYANKFGRLVIATSNKSEAAVGYSTLYGDTAGAFEAISDVFKTDVWALCRWRNAKAGRELIPASIIDRAPSAELREAQTDSESLPPYEVLDEVLRLYIEQGLSSRAIIERGFDADLVKRVIRMLHRAEFKRRQCPIGARVSPGALSGPAWNYPMTIALK